MDIKKLLEELTVEEKAKLVAGTNFMYTCSVPRLNIPAVRMSDGPHGLRVQKEGGDNGITSSEPATAFPTATTVASSWNPENMRKMGEAIAEECAHYGINVVLGPATNIKRNPLGGRNFEYFSEDPLLSGKMAAAEVKGVQSKGVGVSAKHFALNNSENYRFLGDSICDMRAIREIYLKPFEIIVKEGKPQTLMCAYNKINGTYCSQNKWLLTDVLRNEWGFDGLVMSDWGATHDRIEMLRAGLNLEMPGDTAICCKWIIDGIKDGTLDMNDLNKAVENVLGLVQKHEQDKKSTADFKKNHVLAAEIASDSAVLLKNDSVLPLANDESLFVVGELFEKMRYQGAGSSMINPTSLSAPKTAFDERGIKYVYVKGYKENQIVVDEKLLNEAVVLSKNYDKVLVFAGLTDYVESEGIDRKNMRLPENQLCIIDTLIQMGKKVIVILYGGSPIELPFADRASAILNMFLPGQNGGEATASLIFGDKTPCGKLAETWPECYEDVPFGNDFSKSAYEIYKESILVGYRYYLTANKKVRYPFGYGLSYTSFKYASIRINESKDEIEIICTITNNGKYDGAETVQLYVKAPQSDVYKPLRELKGFAKIYLKAGESKEVTITVKKEDLRYWNIKENRWVLEDGEYAFELCSDCQTVRIAERVFMKGETITSPYAKEINKIYAKAETDKMTDTVFEQMSGLKIPTFLPKKPITLESKLTDLKYTFFGSILYKAIIGVAEKDMKKAKKLPDGIERDNRIKGALFMKRVMTTNSLITMSMSAGKRFPYNFATGFINLANGKLIKGIKCFCTKIKVSKSSKEKVDRK
ncbi:MAG: glycosyl hydrolase [Acholeplasmataceae bacterium]|jgi:beta-glucosidase|nr:glycosyl hydrolase [Acholeplasmataceae bacterium]